MLYTSSQATSQPELRPHSTSASVPKGHKRTRSLPRRLSLSASCPHLPLLAATASSPPAVTSAVAFGSTTPTSSYTLRPRTGREDVPASENPKRMSAGFPWESRPSSGRLSPAVEYTEYIARQSRPSTPPLQHSVSDPVIWSRPSRSSTKSSLKLELPPPRIDAPYGNSADGHSGAFQGAERTHNRSAAQTLLNYVYPATPDIGMNNEPVTPSNGGLDRDGRSGGGAGQGTGAAVAQGLLNATSTRIRGGLNLLTPPDDLGVLDWRQQNDLHRDAEGDINMLDHHMSKQGRPRDHATDGAHGAEAKVTPGHNTERTGRAGPTAGGASSDPADAKDGNPREEVPDGAEEVVEDDWISSAMSALVGSGLPVSTLEESVRILSYALPCPLPASEADMIAIRNGKLPESAAAAPAVAEAAGQQLSPPIRDRCTSRGSEDPELAGSGITQLHGHEGMTTALHGVTAAVQRKYMVQGASRVYIHITHAIDPRTAALSRFPSTPPLTGGPSASNTPGTEMQGGYFSPTVFNAMVIASASQPSTPTAGFPPVHPPISLSTPNPILPPSSLHLTLLERYIPPGSLSEDKSMFRSASSPIVDRLFELSPHGGSLLFIYPTKTGADDFNRKYLAPVLDPLLRKLMVLYMLRENLLWSIRNMAAAADMAEYPDLEAKVRRLCRTLSKGTSTLPKTPVQLVYATKATIALNELSWREWWTQQEQLRIREMVKDHFAKLTPTPGSAGSGATIGSTATSSMGSNFGVGYGVPGDLAREVLDGVRAPAVRPSSRGMGEAVLASSMSGTGSSGGDSGCAGAGPAGMTQLPMPGMEAATPARRKGVEVGIFILRRGTADDHNREAPR